MKQSIPITPRISGQLREHLDTYRPRPLGGSHQSNLTDDQPIARDYLRLCEMLSCAEIQILIMSGWVMPAVCSREAQKRNRHAIASIDFIVQEFDFKVPDGRLHLEHTNHVFKSGGSK